MMMFHFIETLPRHTGEALEVTTPISPPRPIVHSFGRRHPSELMGTTHTISTHLYIFSHRFDQNWSFSPHDHVNHVNFVNMIKSFNSFCTLPPLKK